MEGKEDNGDLKSFIMKTLESITKHIILGFELLAIELGGKSTPRSSSSSPHDERKTHGEAIFSKTGPHKRPHEFKNHNGPEIPKFLESKEVPYTTYDVQEESNEWNQLGDECRKVLPFD